METVAARLRGLDRPVIGCLEQRDAQGHVRLSCLAALGLPHLIGLAATITSCIHLDATRCSGCRNEPAMGTLRERLEALEDGGLRGRFRLVSSASDLDFQPRRLPRRGFLRALLSEGVDVTPRGPARPQRRGPAGGKHVPAQRKALETALARLPARIARALRPATAFKAVAASDCDACGRCAAICPTGALLRQRSATERTLEFVESLCVGCDACADFCPTNALRIEPATVRPSQPRVRIAKHDLPQETPV